MGGNSGCGRKEIKDLSCFRCREKGHFSHSCPIKREDAVCTFKGCTTPNGHIIKACKNKNRGPKNKGGKSKKEEKAKKVEDDDKDLEEEESPGRGDSGEEDNMPNTPAPSTSKRIIVRSTLVKNLLEKTSQKR